MSGAHATGFVVWFTGLSGSGKSTLAAMLAAELGRRGVHVEKLDGDEVRTHLSKGLGFSREDRDVNVRRIGFVAKLLARAGACAITAAISPYREIRDEQRRAIPRFLEVYTECPVPALAERDPKGLYRKALAGELRHFTGVDDPYEPPLAPDVHVHTDREPPEASLAKIVAALEDRGWIARASHGATAGARGLVPPHGGEPVDRCVRGAARDALAERARAMPWVALDEATLADLAGIARGAYAPLRGFAGEKDWRRVVREGRLEAGLVWPVPIVLPVDDDALARIGSAAEIALRTGDGRMVAVLEVEDRFTRDKELEATHVLGTTDRAHPGVARLAARGATCLGGEVRVLDDPLGARGARELDPEAVRAEAAALGWRRVVALRARGPMRRVDEYVAKCALESADGLLVQLAAGPGHAGDVPVELAARACEALLARHFPPGRARLVVDRTPARHAGAREAVLHAIVAQNHGASALIVDRDERDALDRLAAGDLGIAPLAAGATFFPDGDDRDALRPEIAAILAEARRGP